MDLAYITFQSLFSKSCNGEKIWENVEKAELISMREKTGRGERVKTELSFFCHLVSPT